MINFSLFCCKYERIAALFCKTKNKWCILIYQSLIISYHYYWETFFNFYREVSFCGPTLFPKVFWRVRFKFRSQNRWSLHLAFKLHGTRTRAFAEDFHPGFPGKIAPRLIIPATLHFPKPHCFYNTVSFESLVEK